MLECIYSAVSLNQHIIGPYSRNCQFWDNMHKKLDTVSLKLFRYHYLFYCEVRYIVWKSLFELFHYFGHFRKDTNIQTISNETYIVKSYNELGNKIGLRNMIMLNQFSYNQKDHDVSACKSVIIEHRHSQLE